MRSDRVDLISYIKWCDVLNCGCDVTCSAYDVIHIVAVKLLNDCVVITLSVIPYKVDMS